MKLDKLDYIIKDKKTKLCFSADFTTSKELIMWIHIVGPYICILKTHIDILDDFEPSLINKLNELKSKYKFLILEDRKFADIGKTFYKQLTNGIYKISSWADIVTIHGISGDGMLEYLRNTIDIDNNIYNNKQYPKILVVSQMSNKNNFIDIDYTNKCYSLALKYPKLVVGFIAQERSNRNDNNNENHNDNDNDNDDINNFYIATPGIRLKKEVDADQQYKTPEEAYNSGSDIIIVGSGIYESQTPLEEIKKYIK